MFLDIPRVKELTDLETLSLLSCSVLVMHRNTQEIVD